MYRKRINQYERVQRLIPGREVVETCSSANQTIHEWEYYKKVVNPYELVYTQKKYENFPESVCMSHPLSRSYFKILEIMECAHFFRDFPKSNYPRLRSAHVCEGPGGFIEGFLDLCGKNKVMNASSTAITLKPRQPNVPGWKRAAIFLKRNKNVRIEYGVDGTGDLLNYENQDAFIHACAPNAHLFTADGGFDFSLDYDAQEQTIYPLLIASVRTGFEVLAVGGLFVLKFFDIYYPGTHDLLFFLQAHFHQWSLYKPATSRPCNPEIYFVGMRYKGITPSALGHLRRWSREACAGNSPPHLFRIPMEVQPFSSILNRIIRTSVTNQITYLAKVFALLEAGKEEQDTLTKRMLQIHEVQSYLWCKTFNVPLYPERSRSIEALQTCLQASGLL